MSGRIGGINVFDPTLETLTWWNERLDSFFWANDIKDEKKVPALLSLVGAKTYALLSELTSPKLPTKNSYGHLTRFLKNTTYQNR